MTQNLWESAKAVVKREVYRDTMLPQETRKTQNRQSNSMSKAAGKRRTTTKKQSQQKERNNKYQSRNK